MTKVTLIALAALVLGCSLSPNVYQPEGTGCSEIEYRWTNDTGEHQAFYTGSGGFCAYLTLDFSQDITLQARCVTRDPSGEITNPSPWVSGVMAPSVEEFRRLCPVD